MQFESLIALRDAAMSCGGIARKFVEEHSVCDWSDDDWGAESQALNELDSIEFDRKALSDYANKFEHHPEHHLALPLIKRANASNLTPTTIAGSSYTTAHEAAVGFARAVLDAIRSAEGETKRETCEDLAERLQSLNHLTDFYGLIEAEHLRAADAFEEPAILFSSRPDTGNRIMATEKSGKKLTGRERLSSPEFLEEMRSLMATPEQQKKLQEQLTRIPAIMQGVRDNLQRLCDDYLIDEAPKDGWLEDVTKAAKRAGIADFGGLTLGEFFERCDVIAENERWKAKLLAEELKQQPPAPALTLMVESTGKVVIHPATESPPVGYDGPFVGTKALIGCVVRPPMRREVNDDGALRDSFEKAIKLKKIWVRETVVTGQLQAYFQDPNDFKNAELDRENVERIVAELTKRLAEKRRSAGVGGSTRESTGVAST